MSATITNCWQSLQFYVSKPFSPPAIVDTKACPNYRIVAKSEHKVPKKALNCGFYAVSRVRRLLVTYTGADTSPLKSLRKMQRLSLPFVGRASPPPHGFPLLPACPTGTTRNKGLRPAVKENGEWREQSAPNPCKY